MFRARGPGAARFAVLALFSVLTLAPTAASGGEKYQLDVSPMPGTLGTEPQVRGEPPAPCTEDCWVLSHMSVRGAAGGTLTFELKGTVRAREEQKIPLFGPPGQVRVDDVTIDGARATIGFDSDHYYLLTSAKNFTLRGKLALGTDQILSIQGPLVSFDAQLSKGKLVEGDKLSGLTSTVLHFDPMTDEDGTGQQVERAKTPPTFRLSRSLRFGNETSFVYRLASSHTSEDLGPIRLPLALGEKVKDVQGSTGWTVEGTALVLPTTGKEADITISGTVGAAAPAGGVRSFKTDERSAYEWWMIETDPEHRVAVGGEPKLVQTGQSPIQPTTPSARVYLVQRGQHLEVDVQSLVRGDVLAAVARTHHAYVAITGRGELISDEVVTFENHGLDHLMVTPAGKAMYLSTDAQPERILHTDATSRDVLVPIPTGSHNLRVQSLTDVRVWPLAGALSIPASTYPLATSASEVTVGLPENVHPLAVFGGDRARWAFSRGDLVAAALGIVLACFGFRTRRTRALGALVTAGLWFVSREAFVVVCGGLFLAGAVFLASRFVRGTWLLAASGLALVVTLFSGRFALQSDVATEPKRELFVESPVLPTPEHETFGMGHANGGGDVKAGVTPVSLSFPTSERYVQSSRQLVTRERPFVPRIVYVTSSLIGILHLVWGGLLLLLGWMHRDRLLALKERIVQRLTKAPEAAPEPREAADPF